MDYKSIHDSFQKYLEKYASLPTELDPIQATKLAVKLGVSVSFIYAVYRVFIYNLYIHPANRIPGPGVGRVAFMGNFFEIVGGEVGAVFKRWSREYGGIVNFHGQWNRPTVLVTDPNLLKQVLTSQTYDFVKTPRTSNGLRRILGNGVLVAEGNDHRYQRKMLNPAFTVSNIRAMVPLMAKPAFMLRDKWLDAIQRDENKLTADDGKQVTELEISSSLSLATLDVIGWAFGQDFKSLEYYGTEKQSRLSRAYLHIFSNENPLMRILSFLIPWIQYIPTERNIKTRQNLKWLDIETRALVQAGIDRAIMEKRTGIKRGGPKDLLDIMIDLKDDDTNQKFTVDEIKNQCLTFLAAGHETTSVSLSWCLWLLAKNKKIQDELRDEVLTLFKDETTVPTYEEINSLPLLDNVVRETLRLIPAVPVTNRISNVPVVLGSHVLPKGTVVFLPIIAVHHSKAIWGEDAEEFNPYRWNSDKVGNAYEYLPFLAGARQCIGYKFALVEFKIILAILIRKLEFYEKPGFTVAMKQQITLKPFPQMRVLARLV